MGSEILSKKKNTAVQKGEGGARRKELKSPPLNRGQDANASRRPRSDNQGKKCHVIT